MRPVIRLAVILATLLGVLLAVGLDLVLGLQQQLAVDGHDGRPGLELQGALLEDLHRDEADPASDADRDGDPNLS